MTKNRRITDLEVRVANLECARRNLLISVECTDRAVAALEDQIADLEDAHRTQSESDTHTEQRQSDSSGSVGRSADLRTRIAAVVRLHQWRAVVRESDDDSVLNCTCGMSFGPHQTFDCYREHQADAVIRELKLDQPVDFTSAAWGTADE